MLIADGDWTMQRIVVTFDDSDTLTQTLSGVVLDAGSEVHLLYASAHRPARLKRWVSRSGWERLALERGRKLAAPVVDSLIRQGYRVEFHAAVNDAYKHVYEHAHDLAARLNARIVDARAPQQSVSLGPVSLTQHRAEPMVRYRPTRRVFSPA
jgi:hypothetical protein